MSNTVLNFIILIAGLLLVSALWIGLAKGREEKIKTAKFLSLASAVGILSYVVQIVTGLG